MSKLTGPGKTYANVLAHWDRLLAGAEANRADLPELEQCRAQLEAALVDTREAHARREGRQAETHRMTQDLQAFLSLGRDLAAQLEDGVKHRYGRKNPKLAEFGMKPVLPRRKPKTVQGCMVKGCPLEATATAK
jgi:uncharacterized membrane protein YccC